VFANEQILKDCHLTFEELMDGCVGGGGDGGLDAFFPFVNGVLLEEDSDLSNVGVKPDVLLYVGQVKETGSYQEVVFDKATPTLKKLLDQSVDESELRKRYSAALVDRAMVFRNKLQELAARHPNVSVRFVYATKGDTAKINANVYAKANELAKAVEQLFPGCAATVDFFGAAHLLELANRQATYTLSLAYVEGPLTQGDSHVVLVRLSDYFKCITDDAGLMRHYIFEWNVRDYQGNVEVNVDIQRTLNDPNAPPFWWLNNGITIIASKASITGGKVLFLDDVQIVNGLQTSVEIYNFLKPDPTKGADRLLLGRVVVTADPAVRDRIIKATNFQTSVSAASLRATDEIQRRIEQYFMANGWYYDRRKGYYKNHGKPADRIVSIPYLAQAVMAMGWASRTIPERGPPH